MKRASGNAAGGPGASGAPSSMAGIPKLSREAVLNITEVCNVQPEEAYNVLLRCDNDVTRAIDRFLSGNADDQWAEVTRPSARNKKPDDPSHKVTQTPSGQPSRSSVASAGSERRPGLPSRGNPGVHASSGTDGPARRNRRPPGRQPDPAIGSSSSQPQANTQPKTRPAAPPNATPAWGASSGRTAAHSAKAWRDTQETSPSTAPVTSAGGWDAQTPSSPPAIATTPVSSTAPQPQTQQTPTASQQKPKPVNYAAAVASRPLAAPAQAAPAPVPTPDAPPSSPPRNEPKPQASVQEPSAPPAPILTAQDTSVATPLSADGIPLTAHAPSVQAPPPARPPSVEQPAASAVWGKEPATELGVQLPSRHSPSVPSTDTLGLQFGSFSLGMEPPAAPAAQSSAPSTNEPAPPTVPIQANTTEARWASPVVDSQTAVANQPVSSSFANGQAPQETHSYGHNGYDTTGTYYEPAQVMNSAGTQVRGGTSLASGVNAEQGGPPSSYGSDGGPHMGLDGNAAAGGANPYMMAPGYTTNPYAVYGFAPGPYPMAPAQHYQYAYNASGPGGFQQQPPQQQRLNGTSSGKQGPAGDSAVSQGYGFDGYKNSSSQSQDRGYGVGLDASQVPMDPATVQQQQQHQQQHQLGFNQGAYGMEYGQGGWNGRQIRGDPSAAQGGAPGARGYTGPAPPQNGPQYPPYYQGYY